MAISISKIVGRGYDDFWTWKGFYRVCKGSKGSKKSKTSALWYIYHMMKYPDANTLVIRRFYRTIMDSCVADLLWAMDKLGVSHLWKLTKNPSIEMVYLPTGQKILFRGLDKAEKLASVSVPKGILCWVWFEEAYEVANEAEFDKIAMSIRGRIPPETGLWKQITLTFNPWSEHTWLKSRFFDNPKPNVLAKTTTFRDNEFLDDVDVQRYLDMYQDNPRAARVICDGDWGVAEGLIYNNWEIMDFDIDELKRDPNIKHAYGLDFGYAASYNAFVAIAADIGKRKLWIYDEMYEKGLTNIDIAKKVTAMGYSKEIIWADAAEPKSIYELEAGLIEERVSDDGEVDYHRWQLPSIRPALKGPDSVANGIQRLQAFRIYVHPSCKNVIMELNNYCYDVDKDGNFTDKPIKDFDHCLVAGTMILTDHGQVPIEDIQVGDLVMTHLGYMPVEAAGITQLEAEIWRLECEDGTILEGTWNHPLITNAGIVYMKHANGLHVVKHGVHSSMEIQSNPDMYHLQARDPVLNQKRGSESIENFVSDAMNDKNGCGLVKVKSIENTGRKEIVYDLTVAVAHDFFANGLITSNCMDAIRYASTAWFITGKGYVAEAKGGRPSQMSGRSKRVVSSTPSV